ncbi:MAG: cheW3-2 [Gammaproteobacteria bacterium]|jgi:chemotaxis signal transduction protein|nr:cheW3-2 [Gammaproteobacteria bacterium]
MSEPSPVAASAAQLRSTFDQARAVPFLSDAVERIEDLLAIRVSGDAFAIRLSEISGLATDRKIVAFPSPIPELLGVAAIRGRLVPVYSLAALLGYSAQSSQGRWLMLCGTEEPVGLAINDFEGYVRVPLAQVYTAEQKDAASAHVKHVVRAADMVRGVVSIPLIMEIIQRRCRSAGDPKES